MRQLDFGVFDADNHYYEAEDAFTRHIEPQFSRRAVQWAVIDGRKRLLVGGRLNRYIPNPTFDPIARPGVLDEYFRGRNPTGAPVTELFGELEPIRPEYRDRDARLTTMDAQGLDACFLFPTLGVGMEAALTADPPACAAAFRAFNRWLDEDWGFAFRQRLFAAPYLTLAAGVAEAVAELEWCISRDARIICMRESPVQSGSDSRSPADAEFDPFWARVEEAGLVVAFHGGDPGYDAYVQAWERRGDARAFDHNPLRNLMAFDRQTYDVFGVLVVHGLLSRFPGLRLASIENGSEWVAPLLKKLKKSFGQTPQYFDVDPVGQFKEHVWVAPFYEDDIGGLIELLGTDRVLFGSDWPHTEGLREPLDFLHDVPELTPGEMRAVMHDNAASLVQPVTTGPC